METEQMNETPKNEVPPTAPAADVDASEASVSSESPTAPEQDDPHFLGRLTPEELGALMQIQQETQRLLTQVGDFEFKKSNLLRRVTDLDAQARAISDGVAKRINLKDGQTWVATADGNIRVVASNQASQDGGGGTPPG